MGKNKLSKKKKNTENDQTRRKKVNNAKCDTPLKKNNKSPKTTRIGRFRARNEKCPEN